MFGQTERKASNRLSNSMGGKGKSRDDRDDNNAEESSVKRKSPRKIRSRREVPAG